MKLLKKKIKSNGKVCIYLLGVKIFSYKDEIKPLYTEIENLKQELFYIKEWQKDFFRDNPTAYPIRLSNDEISKITEYQNKSINYLEYGLGGSTFLALNSSVKSIYSVESDQGWISYIESWKLIRDNQKNNRLNIKHVNIGKTKEWGYPVDDKSLNLYPNYSNVFKTNQDIKKIDTFFIDGRFRVACALSVILNCTKNATILMHDYIDRPQYHIIEKFLDRVDEVDTLAVFKLKNDIDLNDVKNLYEEYKYIVE